MAPTAITSPIKSPHVSDPLLQPFLSLTFSPSSYLNTTLPPLSHTSSSKAPPALSLTDLASQTQTHIAQLSAQTSRLSDTLTSLTDDILRSSSRLAYEVEVLRGETVSLTELLSEGLTDDIVKFLPEGLDAGVLKLNGQSTTTTTLTANPTPSQPTPSSSTPPSSIPHLRTLLAVRTRLQTVISTFDTALSWPFPPSLTTSLPSSLLTISAPSSTPAASQLVTLEDQGQAACQRLKDEITDLLNTGGAEGILAAEERVEALRQLVGVWKGTAEEKARGKFVEGLGKMVLERRREEERKGGVGSIAVARGSSVGGLNNGGGAGAGAERSGEKATAGGSTGFLRRLRDEIYLE